MISALFAPFFSLLFFAFLSSFPCAALCDRPFSRYLLLLSCYSPSLLYTKPLFLLYSQIPLPLLIKKGWIWLGVDILLLPSITVSFYESRRLSSIHEERHLVLLNLLKNKNSRIIFIMSSALDAGILSIFPAYPVRLFFISMHIFTLPLSSPPFPSPLFLNPNIYY